MIEAGTDLTPTAPALHAGHRRGENAVGVGASLNLRMPVLDATEIKGLLGHNSPT